MNEFLHSQITVDSTSTETETIRKVWLDVRVIMGIVLISLEIVMVSVP